jgi:hypothetical protein
MGDRTADEMDLNGPSRLAHVVDIKRFASDMLVRTIVLKPVIDSALYGFAPVHLRG